MEKQVEVNQQVLGKQAEVHDKDSIERKNELSKEHGSLSKELSDVKATVGFLRDGRIADEARREAIKGQELDPQKALDTLHVSLSQMADARSELSEAKKEIEVLQKENAALREENETLRQELAQSQESGEEELEP